ncbi:MAG TPA: hypothetical protein PK036_11390 [Geobacteraceae bacterium]|nr:hypothetical protein [Geobacteraceae bacterium]
MPITIYRTKQPSENLACLCDNCWELPIQVSELEKWLDKNKNKIPTDDYVADIGFTQRSDASGGGAAISPESMGIMAKAGMWLSLSEYR